MPTVLALLHGVKVGTARRVPMAAWRAQPASLGYGQVQTLLNSGNAVFRAPGRAGAPHARAIAAAIERGLGFRVPVQVKSAAQLTAIVAGNPLADSVADPARLLVAFAPDAPTLAALRGIAPLVAPPMPLSSANTRPTCTAPAASWKGRRPCRQPAPCATMCRTV